MVICAQPALQAYLDSGAPEGSSNYTTFVMMHGVIWHGATFKKLIQLATHNNARFIALNRRDYPGSAPYTPEERAVLERLAAAPQGSDAVQSETWDFLRERARDIYEYLVDLVARERIPLKQGEGPGATGGIVVGGWSFAGHFLMAFLTHASSFDVDQVLARYVRSVTFYDCAIGLGVLPIANSYHPFHDDATPVAERIQVFNDWASGYFEHGEPIVEETLAMRNALDDPPPSLQNMTVQDRLESTHEHAGIPDGSDSLIAQMIAVSGVATPLKDAAFALPFEKSNRWRDVDVKVVWCDQSIWISVWAVQMFLKELEELVGTGKRLRKVSFLRFKGANHFAHWDLPEETLRLLLV